MTFEKSSTKLRIWKRSRDSVFRSTAGLILLILAAFLVACSAAVEQEPDLCDDDGMLLIDDFDGSRDCGWQLYSGRGVTEVIEDGVLSIETSQPGLIGWALAGREFEDVIINENNIINAGMNQLFSEHVRQS